VRRKTKKSEDILSNNIGLVDVQGTVAKSRHSTTKYACSSWVAKRRRCEFQGPYLDVVRYDDRVTSRLALLIILLVRYQRDQNGFRILS
jgi:hypothetical protein